MIKTVPRRTNCIKEMAETCGATAKPSILADRKAPVIPDGPDQEGKQQSESSSDLVRETHFFYALSSPTLCDRP